MTRADTADTDSTLGEFLDLLAADIASHPDRLQVVYTEIRKHAQCLVEGIEVDLDLPLSEDDE
ncbi:type II toxin-antitoxin system PrlF family antitoxin [Pseudomonas nitroreducens]|uniref:type II toxin-antitoxin system PrlF family antitoxin n=1 Tax=Pseudomonas nitroreducens TaxID=46680 RepID=UPI0034602895